MIFYSRERVRVYFEMDESKLREILGKKTVRSCKDLRLRQCFTFEQDNSKTASTTMKKFQIKA